MNYIEYEIKLNEATDALPVDMGQILGGKSPVTILHDIAGDFELTMNEVGELCELVRQIIAKEMEPKDLEAKLAEKLDEDNREKIPQLVSMLSERIFSKLLPALGIKVPLEFAVLASMPPKVETAQTETAAPDEPFTLKRMPPVQPLQGLRPPQPTNQSDIRSPIVRGTAFSGASSSVPENLPAGTPSFFQGRSLKNAGQPTFRSRPPIIETSHEQMSAKPLESLLQMLNGKVSERDMIRQYEKLPLQLKEALRSVDSARKVVDIGRKYALHVDKLAELGSETGMVILGFTHPGQFLARLTRQLDLPEEKVRPIAQEINAEVFVKIREALKQIHNEMGAPPQTSAIPVKPAPFIPKPVPASKPFVEAKPVPTLGGEDNGGMPDRETILREIENPKLLWWRKPTASVSVNPEPQRPAVSTKLDMSAPEEPARQTKPAEPLAPQTPAPVLPQPYAELASEFKEKADTLSAAPSLTTPAKTTAAADAFWRKPVPNVSPAPPKNILERKLSGTVTSPKTDASYSADPYRETPQ